MLRLDHHSKDGYMTAAYLFHAFAKSGYRFSKASRNLVVQNYALAENDAAPLRPSLKKEHELDRLEGTRDISLAGKSASKHPMGVKRSLRHSDSVANETINRRRSTMAKYV